MRRSLAFPLAALAIPVLSAAAQSSAKVGPPRGAVVVVGGGSIGPDVYTRFIELAGGPDALIVDVPTAGGDSTYPSDWRGTRGLKAAGARHVVVLHTVDRKTADDSAFASVLARAGGVWFEGGRQWHLVDSYAGTRTERGFHDVLARGGVVGGTSAGASILSSYLLRGARAGNSVVMAPEYETGFGFLRGVAIDQHVVARERLPDLADSLLPRRPDLLGISEDEGTAWVVRGDVAEIVGRNKAFVYGGKDATDAGRPFLTLYPGDRYDLAARHVVRRASAGTPVAGAFLDSLFASVAGAGGKATVLVAQAGAVLADRSYGIAPQPRYMPTTTVPNFALGGLSDPWNAILVRQAVTDGALTLDTPLAEGSDVTVAQYLSRARPAPDGARQLADLLTKRAGAASFNALANRRLYTPIGAHKTTAADGRFSSNVDELYRLALALEYPPTFFTDTSGIVKPAAAGDRESLGWRADTFRGLARLSAFGTDDGKRNAFVRIPARRLTVIVLTDRDDVDARALSDRIVERMVSSR